MIFRNAQQPAESASAVLIDFDAQIGFVVMATIVVLLGVLVAYSADGMTFEVMLLVVFVVLVLSFCLLYLIRNEEWKLANS